jgi:hypothetical protein
MEVEALIRDVFLAGERGRSAGERDRAGTLDQVIREPLYIRHRA